jgi:hypothetical protein
MRFGNVTKPSLQDRLDRESRRLEQASVSPLEQPAPQSRVTKKPIARSSLVFSTVEETRINQHK